MTVKEYNKEFLPKIPKAKIVIEIIDKNLKYASRIFNVVIPQSELIYIAEIFEPYLSLKY